MIIGHAPALLNIYFHNILVLKVGSAVELYMWHSGFRSRPRNFSFENELGYKTVVFFPRVFGFVRWR